MHVERLLWPTSTARPVSNALVARSSAFECSRESRARFASAPRRAHHSHDDGGDDDEDSSGARFLSSSEWAGGREGEPKRATVVLASSAAAGGGAAHLSDVCAYVGVRGAARGETARDAAAVARIDRRRAVVARSPLAGWWRTREVAREYGRRRRARHTTAHTAPVSSP